MRLQLDGISRNPRTVRGEIIIGTSYITPTEPRGYEIRDNVCTCAYVVQGGGKILALDGTATPFGAGDAVLTLPGVPRTRILNDEVFVDQYLILPTECYPLLRRLRLVDPARPVLRLGRNESLPGEFDAFEDYVRAAPERDTPRLLARALDFFIRLLTLPEPVADPERLEQAARLLRESDRSIPEIAAAIGMSATHLRRRFAAYYRRSPVDYRNQNKIDIARELLAGDIPLGEIAARLGYPDLTAFSRQFRQYAGCAPGAYRLSITGFRRSGGNRK